MRVDDVDIFKLQALQRCPRTLDDVFSRKTVVVDEDFAIGEAPVELVVLIAG